MNGLRHELMHHTDEQVREYVTKALRLVEELAPPDDLRAAVLAAAINLYSGKQIMFEQHPTAIPHLAVPRGI